MDEDQDPEQDDADGSADDDTSSPHDYTLESPPDDQVEEDGELGSPHSTETQDQPSDVEVDA